jgi:glycerol kinase
MTLACNQTVPIAFDSNSGYLFEMWDRVQLFFHAIFSGAKYNYVCENNELYHKRAKQFHLLYNSFDVWFCTNDTKLTTQGIDFFVSELTFKDDWK